MKFYTLYSTKHCTFIALVLLNEKTQNNFSSFQKTENKFLRQQIHIVWFIHNENKINIKKNN